ncbi:hypothetical protein RNJ44_01681 [Nakaseomyces bracarensis]|uniref:t-SNARE coiled-coil homology domain-containing protein n=1 Tax=Nakaseomyces bracarensis TaxID=273131 RepID=A0ABR4NNQ0_9SACH
MLKNYEELLQQIERIEVGLVSYEAKINSIASNQARLLVEVQLESEVAQRKKLDTLVADVDLIQKEIADNIKFLDSQISKNDNEYYVQFHNVRKKFLLLLGKLKSLHYDWKESSRIKLERQLSSLDIDINEVEIKQCIESSESLGNLKIFQDFILRNSTAQEILTNVEKRRQELRIIEIHMAQLLQLFREMEDMVAEQEYPVEKIEIAVKKATEDIEKGILDINSAVKSGSKSYYTMKNISYLIICVMLVIGMVSAITVASVLSKNK